MQYNNDYNDKDDEETLNNNHLDFYWNMWHDNGCSINNIFVTATRKVWEETRRDQGTSSSDYDMHRGDGH